MKCIDSCEKGKARGFANICYSSIATFCFTLIKMINVLDSSFITFRIVSVSILEKLGKIGKMLYIISEMRGLWFVLFGLVIVRRTT